MPTMTFTLGAEATTELVNALCAMNHYQESVPDGLTGAIIQNPESRAAFARRMVINWLKAQVVEHRRRLAAVGDPDIT